MLSRDDIKSPYQSSGAHSHRWMDTTRSCGSFSGSVTNNNSYAFHYHSLTSADATIVSNDAANNMQPNLNLNSALIVAPFSNSSAFHFRSAPQDQNPLPQQHQHHPTASHCTRRESTATRMNDGTLPTHPVPDFLCHVMSMVQDPALHHVIAWVVPEEHEPVEIGGGIQNIGKVVVYDPQRFQDVILGNYYRHSNFSSFQRQMNYFGFKKRIHGGHGGKKGKMQACSFVNENLGLEPSTLLTLKRKFKRPPERTVKAVNDHGDMCHNTETNSHTHDTNTGVANQVTSNVLIPANPHPLQTLLAPQAFLNSSGAGTLSPPSQMISFPTACPQIETFSNPTTIINNKNEIALKHANIAARQAKQSLFKAYQKSQMDLLQKQLDHTHQSIPVAVPLLTSHAPMPILDHVTTSWNQHGTINDMGKQFLDQSLQISVVANPYDMLDNLPICSPLYPYVVTSPFPRDMPPKQPQDDSPIDISGYCRLPSSIGLV